MKLKLNQVFLLIGLGLIGQTTYGQASKLSISKDSAAIITWANGVNIQRGWVNIADTSIKYKGSNKATYGYSAAALGKAGSTSADVVSLGDGGVATLTFDRPISNGVGADFAVFENGQFKQGTDSVFAELGFVEVSSDGIHFVRFPSVSKTQITKQIGSFAPIDAENVFNLAGAELQGFGTAFDLDYVADSANLDVQNIRFVRIVDAIGDINPIFASHDSQGNIVNDPWPTPYWSSGFDLDAVGVVHAGQPYLQSTFETFTLANDSYFTPAATDTVIANGLALFSTEKTAWGINKFTISNLRNDSTPGYTNSFSAITAGGISAPDSGGTKYAISYGASSISFSDKASHRINGFYATNATYTYLSMRDGDAYAKKFGGTTGNDADWFKLQIWGIKADGSKTDTIDFYLADYRFSDNSKDYLVNDWRWVDLSSLGSVKSIQIGMASSDNGKWGMNTPSYFCLDNFTVLPTDAPVSLPISDVTVLKNAQPKTIALDQIFTAYDPSSITFTFDSNSNTSLIQGYLAGNSLTIQFADGQTGTATLKVSGSCNGKTVSNTFKVNVVDQAVGFESISSVTKAFPNPCSSVLNVECKSGSVITIFDVTGRIVENMIADNSTVSIQTDTFSKGYYQLQVVNDTETKTIKIIKE
jgi:hypothetical protein